MRALARHGRRRRWRLSRVGIDLIAEALGAVIDAITTWW